MGWFDEFLMGSGALAWAFLVARWVVRTSIVFHVLAEEERSDLHLAP